MSVFKTLWGNNGDILSLQYAGYLSKFEDTQIERSDAIDRYNITCKAFSDNKFKENYKNKCITILLQKDTRGNLFFL